MKYIQKQTPPPSNLNYFLKWVRDKSTRLGLSSGTDQWKHFDQKKRNHKSNLQNTLIEEQGYICAYCNRRIHKGNPKNDEQLRIDHLQPKVGTSNPITITFNYYNLVACCFGDEREINRTSPPRSLHCDASKKDIVIPQVLFPTNITCEQVLIYTPVGEITTSDTSLRDAVENILNLNCPKLKSARENAIKPYVDFDIQPDEADEIIRKYLTPNPQNQLAPFCGAIIGYLRQNYNATL
jgi:uncharacterized protein (TIGR02646 family)